MKEKFIEPMEVEVLGVEVVPEPVLEDEVEVVLEGEVEAVLEDEFLPEPEAEIFIFDLDEEEDCRRQEENDLIIASAVALDMMMNDPFNGNTSDFDF